MLRTDAMNGVMDFSLSHLQKRLAKHGIYLHFLTVDDVEAVRFVRVETPETVRVEET